MGYRYNLNDRDLGGSMTPRLNPKLAQDGLNAKLGPRPVTRESQGQEPGRDRRRSAIGLPSRFDKA